MNKVRSEPEPDPADAPAPVGRALGQIFADRAPERKEQKARLRTALERHGAQFSTEAEAFGFFHYIVTPRSGGWAFKPSGKTGTTSALHFLFHLEFGRPLRAAVTRPGDLNVDQAAHELARARVFAFLPERGEAEDCLAYLRRTLRLATVRHPGPRALSGFRYFCRAQAEGKEQFAVDRLRMNALVDFDWERHPDTPEGFVRFLEFIRLELAENTTRRTNEHWAPQHLNIRPEVFEPELLGRTENLPAFFLAVAERLDRPLPPGVELDTPRNPQAPVDRDAFLDHPQARRLIAEVFARDFEAFGYDL